MATPTVPVFERRSAASVRLFQAPARAIIERGEESRWRPATSSALVMTRDHADFFTETLESLFAECPSEWA